MITHSHATHQLAPVPALLKIKAAAVLGVSERTMRRLLAAGAIPTVRMLGSVVRVRSADLEAFVARTAAAAPPETAGG